MRRNLFLLAGAGLAALLSMPASAQNGGWYSQDQNQNNTGVYEQGQSRDRDYNRQGDNDDWNRGHRDANGNWVNDGDRDDRVGSSNNGPHQHAYREGWRDGDRDRQAGARRNHDRSFNDQDDHSAYDAGYMDGFNGTSNGGYNGAYNNNDNSIRRDRDGDVNSGYNGSYSSGNPYDQGYSMGQQDRANGRDIDDIVTVPYNSSDDIRAFRAGYNDGFNGADRRSDQYRHRDRDRDNSNNNPR